ncbi:hypothetical protein GGQ84_000111 [Desulfitispora alkaliphila]|uniref:hypothetical protein n=1 Tax=Desulfitispora alkaliphila TaxID=622674 RepID=UPI003D205EEE
MDIFAILLGVVLIAASGLMVGMPLMNNQSPDYGRRESEIENEETPEKKREAIFSILNEIEFDYQTNKLSEGDYSALKDKYKTQALALMKEETDEKPEIQVDLGQLEAEIDAEIEAEVAKMLEGDKEK